MLDVSALQPRKPPEPLMDVAVEQEIHAFLVAEPQNINSPRVAPGDENPKLLTISLDRLRLQMRPEEEITSAAFCH